MWCTVQHTTCGTNKVRLNIKIFVTQKNEYTNFVFKTLMYEILITTIGYWWRGGRRVSINCLPL